MKLEFELKGHSSAEQMHTDFVSCLIPNGGSAANAAALSLRESLFQRMRETWPDLGVIALLLEQHIDHEINLQIAGQAELRGYKAAANFRQIGNRQTEMLHLKARIQALRLILP